MIKSNARMPARTPRNVEAFVDQLLMSPYCKQAVNFSKKMGGPTFFFELLHSIRRWYSGQTMARKLLANRRHLATVMDLAPMSAVGLYRGFKLPAGWIPAETAVGDRGMLPVERNHGFSSWASTEAAANRFSGSGKGKIGVIVRLISSRGIKPVLAPPTHTAPWFNEFYRSVIGNSFRPTEEEFLIYAPKVEVEIVKIKRR